MAPPLDLPALIVAALAVDCGCHRAPAQLDPEHLDRAMGWPAGGAAAALGRLEALRLIEPAGGRAGAWRIRPASAALLSELVAPLAPLFSVNVRAL